MKKNRPYKSYTTNEGLTIQWVGPKTPGDYIAYLRFEYEGKYVGSIDGRRLKTLYRRLSKYFKSNPKTKNIIKGVV